VEAGTGAGDAASDGFPPAGGFGGAGGFGRGVEGTVTAIDDGQLSIEGSDGTISTVLVDDTTTYARQAVFDPDELQPGDTVRIVFGRGGPGGFGPGADQGGTAAAESAAATQVLVLESSA